MRTYPERFFESIREGSRRSASVVVPKLIECVHPRSVIDVGCGQGTWLYAFRECGIQDILGIDGSYVDEKWLQIPKEQFLARDLESPLALDRTFDLVISLEVAEHLSSSCAPGFIDALTGLGPVVAFSAAIPFQGHPFEGGLHHVNEQWPEYWARLFEERGFRTLDFLRHLIWENSDVDWWYRQNLLLFVQSQYLDCHPSLQREEERWKGRPLSIVHPECFLVATEPANWSLRGTLATLPGLAMRAVARRVQRLRRRT